MRIRPHAIPSVVRGFGSAESRGQPFVTACDQHQPASSRAMAMLAIAVSTRRLCPVGFRS